MFAVLESKSCIYLLLICLVVNMSFLKKMAVGRKLFSFRWTVVSNRLKVVMWVSGYNFLMQNR